MGELPADTAVVIAMGERPGDAVSVATWDSEAVSVAAEVGGILVAIAGADVGAAVAVREPAAETMTPNETVVGAGGMTGVAVGTGADEQPTTDRASARSRHKASLLIGDSRDYTPPV